MGEILSSSAEASIGEGAFGSVEVSMEERVTRSELCEEGGERTREIFVKSKNVSRRRVKIDSSDVFRSRFLLPLLPPSLVE